MTKNKEKIKTFIREAFGNRFNTEEEIEEFAEKLLKSADEIDKATKVTRVKIWKKEEIEELGIEVTPVKWEKLE